MSNKNRPYILGLDVGTNSIGWAVVDCHVERKQAEVYSGYKPVSLRALNSRIFLEMVEADTRVPKNQRRREKRSARNHLKYYNQRRKKLEETLVLEGLLPRTYPDNREKTLNEVDRQYAERKLRKTWSNKWTEADKAYRSPYAMRNYALEEKLEPHEFGRLLLHLQKRRGYFSNRGAKYIDLIKNLKLAMPEDDQAQMSNEEKKETRPVLAGINKLQQSLGERTIGQFIWQEAKKKNIAPKRIALFSVTHETERRGRTVTERLQLRAEREMYEKEFDAIWEKQNSFHHLSSEVAEQIKFNIFHQRPLASQKNRVGNCNIFPNKKRVAAMRLEFQEYRTLQMINNIKIEGRPLDTEQRDKLVELANNPDKLNQNGRISWREVAETLGVPRSSVNYSQRGDNGDGKSGLVGNKTAQAISNSIGIKDWRRLGIEKKQVALVEDLHTMPNKLALYNRLVNHWEFSPYDPNGDNALGALELAMNEELEDGYGKHSLNAINKLLPHLRKGMDYSAAVEKIGAQESNTKIHGEDDKYRLLEIHDVPNIANPVVQKALYEIRRVVNSIIKLYGRPAIIRMEMARDMKSSKKHRKEMSNRQKDNRERNEEAEKEILSWVGGKDWSNVQLENLRGAVWRVRVKDREKYKMWHYEQDEKCPYCQRDIGKNELFSGGAEIEHILPYTGFRQNYMNTVVSCTDCNREKERRIPYQAWGADEERWARIQQFAKTHYRKYPSKLRNILRKEYRPEDTDDFVQRQLNDTRYIATASKKMMERYGVPIDVNNGTATDILRRHLGLHNILPRDPASSAYDITKNSDDVLGHSGGAVLQYVADKAKKARQDHRQHAIDAFVVAITDRAMLKKMVEVYQQRQDDRSYLDNVDLSLPSSWENTQSLRKTLQEKLQTNVVSHMAKRKVWGALHKDLLYGKSYFNQRLNIESASNSVLSRVKQITQTNAVDDAPWVADEKLRLMLAKWVAEMQNVTGKSRTVPNWNGHELKEFEYQIPCMVKREKLTGKLLKNLKEKWTPGTKRWIAEKSTHAILRHWLEQHNLIGEDVKETDIDRLFNETPPRVLGKDGELRAPIQRVRIAQVVTDSYQKLTNAYVQLGSNHHFVLFDNGQEGNDKKLKVNVVSMLEAARRASSKSPIISKEAPSKWDGTWNYVLHLCINDMVKWKDLNIFGNSERFSPFHKQTPYFRVQKMSRSDRTPLVLYLRHHSVSGTDSDWGLHRITSLEKIDCEKVQLGNLGIFENDS